jgi:7-cyano-7-deazaguanine synthase
VILSGGMDSSLCAFIAKKEGYEIIALHFNYSQKTQERELKAFRDIANSVQAIKKIELNLDFFKDMSGLSLIDKKTKVQTTGIEEGIPSTYVPYRNGIFLSIAGAIAEKECAEIIYIGVVEEDSSGYPDCTKEFINSIQKTINLGTKPQTKIKISTPLVTLKKEDIVQKAIEYKVPLNLTWSCYQNSNKACGLCDSCRLRLKGFKNIGLKDKINYSKKNLKKY